MKCRMLRAHASTDKEDLEPLRLKTSSIRDLLGLDGEIKT